MLPGPVFAFEMLTSARRPRFYLLRAGYAFILLLILAQNYYGWLAVGEGRLTPSQVAMLAETVFYSIAAYQVAAVVALTPALVAGSIATEKERKTLHYLLASELSGPEIVLGKLAAKLGQAGACVLVGLPVAFLLSLLGGIEPLLIALVFGGAFSTMFMLAGLSIWLSAVARKARDAVFAAYAMVAVWLILPFPLGGVPTFRLGPVLGNWANEAIGLVRASNPLYVGIDFLRAFAFGAGTTLPGDLARMIVIQIVVALFFGVLAAWRLRPAFRRQEDAPRSTARTRGRTRRRRSFPPIGDDPMRWKERWTTRNRGLAATLGKLASLGLCALILYWTALAFLDAATGIVPPSSFNEWAAWITATLLLLPCLAALTTAAGSVTSEIEGDTWIGLTATTLEGCEILRAKFLGAIRKARGGLLLIAGIWLAALAIGAASVVSLALAAVYASVCVVFSAILGLTLSLTLPTSHRAQVFGVAIFVLLNLGGQGVLSVFFTYPPQLFPGCMPAGLGRLLSFRGPLHWWLDRLSGISWEYWSGYGQSTGFDSPGWRLFSLGLTALVYAIASVVLWRVALSRFEVVAGRPMKSRAPAPSIASDSG
jgi:hypothetical protein